MLVLAMYVPYAPPPISVAAAATAASRPPPPPPGAPWHAEVTAVMPMGGVTAGGVRDAAAVASGVADAADWLEQQQQAVSSTSSSTSSASAAAKGAVLRSAPAAKVRSHGLLGVRARNRSRNHMQ